jgi:hypothetical protein
VYYSLASVFSRLIVVDDRVVTSSSYTPRKRRQLESPGVAAGERSVAAPAKNSSLRDKNVVLEEEQTDGKKTRRY